MSANQVEHVLVIGVGAFATAIGYGWVKLPVPEALEKKKALLRWLGPALVVISALLLVADR